MLRAILSLSFAAIAMTASAQSAPSQALTYPPTARGPTVDTLHGEAVADPFRWLEDDNSAETKAWVKAQNAVTDAFLASLPQRDKIRARYQELYNFEKYSVPFKEGPRYYWDRNDGLQQQSVVYSVRKLGDRPEVVLDPNGFSSDGTVSLAGFVPSPDGRYIAYGVSSGGSDWNEWKIRDLITGKDLPETLKWVKFSGASWTRDSRGFFYSRYDAPKAGATLTDTNFFQKLYFHRINTPQEKDVLIHESQQNKEWGFAGSVSDDGRWLVVSVWRGAGRENGLSIFPLNRSGASLVGNPVHVTLDFDGQYVPLANQGNTFFVHTDAGAPKGKVIRFDITKAARQNWQTVVPETAEPLESATAVGGRIFGRYLKDVTTTVRQYSLDGKPLGEVALPGVGTAFGFGGKLADTETFFSFTSMTQPATIYRTEVKAGKPEVFRAPKTAFESSKYETTRVFYTGRDGARVPMFIAHRKGIKLDGENPTILYAYGGFNVTMNPSFRVSAAAWLDMGGVYAIANIRGGGEYGAAWHEAAKGSKRQNAFDDFIAAADWLTANRYAKPHRIGINGGSNGGLLVGVAANQRPQAFGAAVPEVGVMDMLRFHKFTIGWAWRPEYGDPEKAEDFKTLRAYSPLHNLKAQPMPHMMVMTSDHDDRVVPAHSFKYAAQLQSLDTRGSLRLIRIATRAGHGAGTPTSKIIEERSDVLAFFAQTLGLATQSAK